MKIKMSKGRIIGNLIFLTVGPYVAAQLSLQHPEHTWSIISSIFIVRVVIDVALRTRKKSMEQSNVKSIEKSSSSEIKTLAKV